MEIPDKIAQVQTFLLGCPEVLLAWVFGSMASGKSHAASDLDLAVACNHSLSPAERVDLSQKIEQLVGVSVDLIDLLQTHGPVVSEAMSQGIMIVRRDPGFHASLLKRLWFEESDYGPLRRRIQSERRGQAFGVSPKKKGESA